MRTFARTPRVASGLAREAARKIVRHFVHRDEPHARMADHMVIEPLQHHQHVRSAGNVRMDRHREYRVVVFAVDLVELIPPHLFDVAGIDETVAVRRLLDEQHRREIV